MLGKTLIPRTKEQLDNMKYEIARELGVNLQHGDNGALTSRQTGRTGGEMTKRMIAPYKDTTSI